MKTLEFLCASQASTAVSLPTGDQAPPPSAAGREIDRHNPLISDGKRTTASRSFPNIPPCSSHYSPINPLPYHQLSAAASPNLAAGQIGSGDSMGLKKKKKSSSIIRADIARWSCGKPTNLSTPPGSMRFLLNDKSFRDGSTDRVSTSILSTETNQKVINSEILECKTSPPSNQVVVLRVSLHCRGCEGKLRKHLSKMEGVNSFTIDFAAKKVTIMGNITPQGVLESVAKVKNAQFWPSLPSKP